jgi:rod shape-determining protein MreB
MKFSLFKQINRRIGIDLGSTRIRIWSELDGIVVDEPSYIAVDETLGKVVGVGKEAQDMIGRVSGNVTVSQPIKNAMIQDLPLVNAMLRVFLQKIIHSPYFFRPTMMVSVPSTLTEVEKRAMTDMFYALGAREVFFIDQVLAAAIGAGVPIADASGSFLLQLGGGIVEGGIISLGSLVATESTDLAGQHLDENIQRIVRKEKLLNVGSRAAEHMKMKLGSALENAQQEMQVTGQDVLQTIPKEMVIDSATISPAILQLLEKYVQLVKRLFEKIPSELTTDIIDKGMLLSGGMAQLDGLDVFLLSRLGVSVSVVDTPQLSVIKGISQVLENLELFKQSVGYQS